MKRLLISAVLCAAVVCGAAAQGTATIRARMTNTDRDLIYFNFMEQPGANMEFPYKEGRVVEFDAELDDVTIMKINTFVVVVVQPGDEMEIEIEYEGRNYRNAQFSGSSPESVLASETLNRIRAARLTRGYKTNIPAAIVVQTPPDKYFKTSVAEWKEELAMLEEVRDRLTPKVYDFVRAELDAIFIPNIISYPGHDLQDGYWTALDGYEIRNDDTSLRNHSYMGMLNTYMHYMLMKRAHDKGEEYVRPQGMEEEYRAIADLYDGKVRDAAMLVFLYNMLSAGDDFDTVEKLYEDYIAKYNLNPRYRDMLANVMK